MLTAVDLIVMLKEQSSSFVEEPKKDSKNWERTKIWKGVLSLKLRKTSIRVAYTENFFKSEV